jgi:hypothetical protein
MELDLEIVKVGTESSGNYGHAGRPGEVGGSGSGGGNAKEMPASDRSIMALYLVSQISQEQKDFLFNYTADPGLNVGLRTGGDLSPYEKKAVEGMDKAFEKIGPLRGDIKVYRAVESLDFVPDVGKSFIDKGFVSTTADLDGYSRVTADMSDWSGIDNPGKLTIVVSAGSHVIPFAEGLGNKEFYYQKEILLPRGGTFEVVSKKGNDVVLRFSKK